MTGLKDRIRRGREAIAQAEAEGKDVSSWQEHLRKLEAQLGIQELWPYLPKPLQKLSEEKVLALVNVAIMWAWDRALRSLEEEIAARRSKGAA